MFSKEAECCAICRRTLQFDRNELSKQTGKSIEEICDIKSVICGPCTETEQYRSDYFGKVPHIALNKQAE